MLHRQPNLWTLGLVILAAGCGDDPPTAAGPPAATPAHAVRQGARADDSRAAQVDAFCGACHPTPDPRDFPRSEWRREVQQGYDLYYTLLQTKLPVPVMADVIDYYERLAPEEIDLPPASRAEITTPSRFAPARAPPAAGNTAVASLNWLRLPQAESESLILCDMRRGTVEAAQLDAAAVDFQTLATLDNPAHAELCDLDQDGRTEMVIADLGSYPPSDHDRGRVVWLKWEADGKVRPLVLAEQLGRVCDVRPADLDADGDQDLLVAEFGWRTTGRVLALENQGLDDGRPRLRLHELDPRHGSIHVPVVDLNGDDLPDFIALFAQEHEAVEAFVNLGQNRFAPQRLFAADRPTFGSSGISAVDFDQDGDCDILYTNGDMFDSYHLRAFHGIRWLENRGPHGWRHHHLASMPGVHRALAADLDLDGDLDVAACSLIPDRVAKAHPRLRLDSLIWLEQTSPGEFERRVLEAGSCNHATLAVADLDDDGDPDLAVGNYFTSDSQQLPRLTIWWNSTAGGSRLKPAVP